MIINNYFTTHVLHTKAHLLHTKAHLLHRFEYYYKHVCSNFSYKLLIINLLHTTHEKSILPPPLFLRARAMQAHCASALCAHYCAGAMRGHYACAISSCERAGASALPCRLVYALYKGVLNVVNIC